MSRKVLGWITVGLVTLFSGCAMCAHPFDYIGPTVTGQNADECVPNPPRAGSVLSGSMGPTMAYSEVELSFTGSSEDRLLEELMEATPAELEDLPTAATENGWTTRADP